MNRRRKLQILGVSAIVVPILLLFSAVLHIYIEWRRVEDLAIVPTPASEPDNRASYYLNAAVHAVAAPPSLLESMNGLDRTDPKWSELELPLEAVVSSNAQFFAKLAPARRQADCRMPIIMGPGPWGKGEFDPNNLLAASDALYCSAFLKFRNGDYVGGCEDAILILKLGRDVASVGSYLQSSAGRHIYLVGAYAMGVALTQYPLDAQSLDLMQAELPNCDFDPNFSRDMVIDHHRDWKWILHRRSSPRHIWLLSRYGLEPKEYRFAIADYTYVYIERPDPLARILYSESLVWVDAEAPRGVRSIAAMLAIGVAIRRYLADQGKLPHELKDLVPQYLKTVPEDAGGLPLSTEAGDDFFEIVAETTTREFASRSLRFSKTKILTVR